MLVHDSTDSPRTVLHTATVLFTNPQKSNMHGQPYLFIYRKILPLRTPSLSKCCIKIVGYWSMPPKKIIFLFATNNVSQMHWELMIGDIWRTVRHKVSPIIISYFSSYWMNFRIWIFLAEKVTAWAQEPIFGQFSDF